LEILKKQLKDQNEQYLDKKNQVAQENMDKFMNKINTMYSAMNAG